MPDRDLTPRIEALVEESKSVAGANAELVVDQWVDSVHRSVYQDAAHSLAAVGMLAPLLESVLVQSFTALRRKLEGHVTFVHSRFADGDKRAWDCHYHRGNRRKWMRGFVKSTMELSEATRSLLPDGSLRRIALFLIKARG